MQTTTPEQAASDFSAAFKEATAKAAPAEETLSTAAPAAGSDTPANDEAADAAAAAPAAAPAAPSDKAPAAQTPPADKPAGRTIEQLETELASAQHRERSNANRISAVDRQNKDLRAQLAAATKQLEDQRAAQVAAPAPAAAPAAQAEPDVLNQSPDLEKAIQRRVDAALAPVAQKAADAAKAAQSAAEGLTSVKTAVEPISAAEHRRAIQNTWDQLDQEFTPKWREDRSSPEFQTFLANASERVQRQYQEAVTVADCAEVLDLFYARRGGRPVKAEQTPQTPAAPVVDLNTQRLRAAAGVPSHSRARPPAPSKDDFSGAFAEATKHLRKA